MITVNFDQYLPQNVVWYGLFNVLLKEGFIERVDVMEDQTLIITHIPRSTKIE
jgi:hypothetical protein